MILRPKLEWETFKVYYFFIFFCFQQTDDDNQLNLKVSWIQWSQKLIKKISTIFQHYPRSAGQWHSTPSWPHTFHKRSIMAGILFIISGFSWNNIRCFLHFSDRKDLEFSKSSIWKRKKKVKKQDSGAKRTWTGDHSLTNRRSIHLSFLRVDECRWKMKLFRCPPHTTCTSTALASVCYGQRRSFHSRFRVKRQ